VYETSCNPQFEAELSRVTDRRRYAVYYRVIKGVRCVVIGLTFDIELFPFCSHPTVSHCKTFWCIPREIVTAWFIRNTKTRTRELLVSAAL